MSKEEGEEERKEQERELKEHRIKEIARAKSRGLQKKVSKLPNVMKKVSKINSGKTHASGGDEEEKEQEDPDKPNTNQTAEVEFKEIEIVLINDSGNMFVPVVQLLLYQSNPVLRSTASQISVGTVITSEINFFNPRSARWEPILERCKLTVGYIINKAN